MSLIRVFQIVLKGGGGLMGGGGQKVPLEEGMGNFTSGGFFFHLVSI